MSNPITNGQLVEPVEKALISELLNDTSLVEEAILRLEPRDFVSKQMAAIFSVIIKLHAEAKTVDEYTIVSYIDAHKELQFDDYDLVIKKIANTFTSSIDVNDHIDLIKNASIKRQLNNFGQEMIETNIDLTQFDESLWELQKKFNNIATLKKAKKINSMKEVTKSYTQQLHRILDHKETLTGTSTGFGSIDAKTNGFQKGDLIILAARPSVGKTAMAVNFVVNAARDINERNKIQPNNEIVLVFSLEMSAEELCNRMVSYDSYVDLSSFKRQKLSQEELRIVNNSIDKLSELPILIDDNSGTTILDIQTKIKQTALTHAIKLVVIDYLGLLKGPSVFGNGYNRQLEVSMFSRTLKQMARDNSVPILVLAQLNRNLEQRKGEDASPRLSDLRESGAIEQDADIVTFLSKTSIKDEEGEVENNNDNNLVDVEFNIAKNRKGPTGRINFLFWKDQCRFQEKKIDSKVE